MATSLEYEDSYSSQRREEEKNIINVGLQQNIREYGQTRWPRDNPVSQKYREAYDYVRENFECSHIRVIRGDNYCGIRSCVVQLLINGIAIKKEFATADIVKNLLNQYMEEPEWELNRWTFARRLNYTDVREMMFSCIDEFYSQHSLVLDLDKSKREAWVEDLLNREPVVDIKMMETAKLLMFLDLIDIYKNQEAADYPLFVQFIFSRDTSHTPASLLKNILNAVGDNDGLEQIDMCLLGHALGVQITVPRLYRYGREDFILKFPDLPEQNWDKVFLITEDDRHYNIIISDN
ncbi:ubiquitin thioesterase otulin-like [Argonauta hians]